MRYGPTIHRVLRSLKPLFPARATGWVIRRFPKLAEHYWYFDKQEDHFYDENFYGFIEETSGRSAPVIARWLVERYRPASVVDVGCGEGAFLAAFRDLGCTGVGLEYADSGLQRCASKGLTASRFDLTRDDLPPDVRAPLCICFEVAEHLPAVFADRLVNVLAAIAPRLAFTAATPGQGGVLHLNEQPHEYWISRFAARGLRFDEAASSAIREVLRHSNVASWYTENMMLFERTAEAAGG